MAADRAEKKTIGISKQTDEREGEGQKEKGRRAVTKRHWAPGAELVYSDTVRHSLPLEY